MVRARRAQRQNPTQKAAALRYLEKRGLREYAETKILRDQISEEISRKVQGAAVQITFGLAQAGPAWSGEFSSSWDVVPEGKSSSGRAPVEGDVYEYSYSNFPLKRFSDAIKNGKTRFLVVNTAPHADVALDNIQSTFYGIGEPVKPVIRRGWRPGRPGEQDEHYRYMLSSAPRYDSNGKRKEPTGRITAPPDWIEQYTRGGFLQRDLGRGVQITNRLR